MKLRAILLRHTSDADISSDEIVIAVRQLYDGFHVLIGPKESVPWPPLEVPVAP